MTRLALGLLLAVSLVSCDSASSSDDFALDVTVQDASGAPVSGLTVALDTEMGSSFAARGAAGASALFEASVPFPNPSVGAALVQIRTLAGASGQATVEVVDLEGRTVLTQPVSVVPDQSYQVAIAPSEERPLAGGVYRVRTTLGGESVERGMIRSEGFESGRAAFRRIVGETDARGGVRTDDRTAAPALYDDLPELLLTDEQGSLLATVRVPRTVIVTVTDGDREVRETVTLRDGANEVRVRW